MSEVFRSNCGRMELRLGRWQDVLGDVEPDSIICDPPFSERTHKGQRSNNGKGISAIEYGTMTGDLPPMHPRWWAVFSDHTGARHNEGTLERRGLYVFAPVVWVKTNATPRLAGDGPASAVEYITIARPRERVQDPGSRYGYYIGPSVGHESGIKFMGQKPLWLMRRLIKDYSKPDDLICDPFSGSGTTLLAAAMEGRRAIGAEMDPKTYALAVKRLSKGYTERLFREGIKGKQEKLL